MSKKRTAALIAEAIVGLSISFPAMGSVMLTGTSNVNGSSGNYTDASSIPVSSTDLLENQSPISTNYVGNNEALGGNLGVLTDGTTGVGSSDPSLSSNAAFDINNGNWYAEYDLGAVTALESIVVTTGHQDDRLNQHYDLLVSNDGVTFTSLSDGSAQSLGNPGAGFTYTPSTGNGGAAQTTVFDDASQTLATARYVEFIAQNNGSDVFRELDVNPVPEPASLGILGLGTVALLARRRRS